MKIAGLILSGGASRRMGFPKALLEFDGESFLDRLIRIFRPRCSSVTVVLGAEAERIRSALQSPADAQLIVNRDWELGQFSSMQAGLRGVPADADAVLFTPVDYPAMREQTIDAVCDAAARKPASAIFVIPRHNGRRGHPVLFDNSVISTFLALPVNAQARDIVHAYVDRTIYVDVDDPGILRDVDDRHGYDELIAAQARNV